MAPVIKISKLIELQIDIATRGGRKSCKRQFSSTTCSTDIPLENQETKVFHSAILYILKCVRTIFWLIFLCRQHCIKLFKMIALSKVIEIFGRCILHLLLRWIRRCVGFTIAENVVSKKLQPRLH